MRRRIPIFLPIGLMGLLLFPLDALLHAWRPAWWVIIGSLIIASTGFGLWFERERKSRGEVTCPKYAFGIVGILSLGWGFLWSLGEEGLIRALEATRPTDEVGHRYFYPGNSGMGYADGLSKPFHVLWNFGLLGGAIYAICLVPHALLNAGTHHSAPRKSGSQDTNALIR